MAILTGETTDRQRRQHRTYAAWATRNRDHIRAYRRAWQKVRRQRDARAAVALALLTAADAHREVQGAIHACPPPVGEGPG